CTLGLMGLIGVRLNPLMNTIIPLVLVISFANGLHLVFSIRRQLASGQTVHDAIEHAVLKVGPACVLSAVTTAIAFASLALTDSRLIQVFGFTAAGATFISLVLVTSVVPCLASLLLRQGEASATQGNLTWFSEKLDRVCEGLSVQLTKHHVITCVIAVCLLMVSGVAYTQLEPRYRIRDIIPDGGQAAKYAAHIDDHFGGVKTVLFLINSDSDLTEKSDAAFKAVAAGSAVLKAHPKLRNIRSIQEVRENLPAEDANLPLAELLEALPDNLSQRYVSADKRSMLVAASVQDIEALPTNFIRKYMDRQAGLLTASHPGFEYVVTGLATLSAERAIDTISSLNGGLIAAVGIVLVIMGVLFRSWEMAVLSLIANMFAIVVTGLCLFVFNVGLQYVSVVG
ncbi:MAG: MMPL family transporter, partial [Rhizobiales bacterium]|nr:MMPL family transporter [Hyphomicrobiales bacterium]